MHKIVFRNNSYQCRDDETMLQAFLRQGVQVNFSCQKGSCQVCLLHCVDGQVPDKAQDGLRQNHKTHGYFLPCQCQPVGDMEVSDIPANQLYHTAYVYKKELLSENICRLLIDCDSLGAYKAGQFVNLARPEDGVARSYSIANYPENEYYLEFHIKRMKNGELSNWIFDELKEGDVVEVQGPMGDCCYDPDASRSPLLLVAGGTGLAPIIGVLKQALEEGHKGEVHLYHEVTRFDELYLHDMISDLAAKHINFSYFPCIPGQRHVDEVLPNAVHKVIDISYTDLHNWHIYTAGSDEFVTSVRKLVLDKGVDRKNLYSDAFSLKELRQQQRDDAGKGNYNEVKSTNSANQYKEVEYPEPDMELWEALDHGKKLNKILDEFYTIVYEDARLSPFFQKITKQRSIEKVHLFLRQIFSGEKVYFGDRPRNAHHWMVISDELFDYREQIMENCLRNNGLPEHLIKRWLAVEESFRPDIVKDKPWNKVMNGVELPVEGYEELVLDTGAICDSCNKPVDAGTRIRFHLRLGTIYCPHCMTDQRTE